MRQTGIIKQIDSLGRIVIPKTIRQFLGVEYGDAVDLYLDMEAFKAEGKIALVMAKHEEN